MRDKVLCATGDPGEIADTEFAPLIKCVDDHQSGWVGECAHARCDHLSPNWIQLPGAQALGSRKIEAQKVTAIVH
jgi:hypothetical protein